MYPCCNRRYELYVNSAALHRGRGSQSGGGGGRSEGRPEVHPVDAREVTEQLHLIDYLFDWFVVQRLE